MTQKADLAQCQSISALVHTLIASCPAFRSLHCDIFLHSLGGPCNVHPHYPFLAFSPPLSLLLDPGCAPRRLPHYTLSHALRPHAPGLPAALDDAPVTIRWSRVRQLGLPLLQLLLDLP